MYMPIIGADITIAGAAVKWAFIDGGPLTPAVAMRAAYSRALKKTNFSIYDFDLNISVSKDLEIITPYAFAGFNTAQISSVNIENFSDNRKNSFNYGFGGRITFGLINIDISALYDKKIVYSISGALSF